MRNLFYLEEDSSIIRARVGSATDPSVLIYFDSVMIPYTNDCVELHYFENVVAVIGFERFNAIDREMLSTLDIDFIYSVNELLYHYRRNGRTLKFAY